MFFISAGMLIGSGILFVLFSDSTEQHWNKFEDDETDDDTEREIKYSKVPLNELLANEQRRTSFQNS